MLANRIRGSLHLILQDGDSCLSVSALSPFPSTEDHDPAILGTSCGVSLVDRMLVPRIASLPCVLRHETNEFAMRVGSSQVFLQQVGVGKLSRPYVRLRISKANFSGLLQARLGLLVLQYDFLIVFGSQRHFVEERNRRLCPEEDREITRHVCHVFPIKERVMPVLSLLVRQARTFRFALSWRLNEVGVPLNVVVK